MKEFKFTITDNAGIHARPAGLLVKEAERFESDITIETENGKTADAKRLFAVMSLGVQKDDTITVKISGNDEENAESSMLNFLQNSL